MPSIPTPSNRLGTVGSGREHARALSPCSIHRAKELSLKDELALLIPLGRLVRLVVLPADNLATDAARDVAHNMAARRHGSLGRFARLDVDYRVEEVRFAMLTAEVLFDSRGARDPNFGEGRER